jgi:hypothetical protein
MANEPWFKRTSAGNKTANPKYWSQGMGRPEFEDTHYDDPLSQLADAPPDISGVTRQHVLQYAQTLQSIPSQFTNKDGSSKMVFPKFPLGDTKTLYTEMQKLADEMGPQSHAAAYATWMKNKYGKVLGVGGPNDGTY